MISSMMVNKYLESPYDLFENGPQILECINSNTSVYEILTGFRTLCIDFDRVHGLELKVEG
jgi:hypothetical protein